MACSLTRTLTALLLVTACTSPREDPRSSNPAAQQNQSTNGGGGAGGGTGSGGGSSSSSSSGGSGSGASSAGGAAGVTVADCACGMAASRGLGECGTCIASKPASFNPQCTAQQEACLAEVGCSGSLNTLGNCTTLDQACWNSISGIPNAAEADLLSELFECLCAPTVCGSVCDPNVAAFSCELTPKP